MKKKTELRIEKRKKLLPAHTPDTCIFMSYLVGDKNEVVCRKYISRINAIYRGFVSLSVYGELLNEIFEESDGDSEIYHELLADLFLIIKHQRFEYYVPSSNVCNICEKIRFVDSRMEPVDKDILNNTKIERKFGIKIKHPMEL